MKKTINLNSFLSSYQKKLENDFKGMNLCVQYNTFRYCRYLDYIINNNISKKSFILEIGCYNVYGMELFKYLGYNNILGVDIDEEAILLGKNRGLKIINLDIFIELKYKSIFNKFEIVILNNVFHDDYIETINLYDNFITMFKNIYLILKKGGIVIFNFHKEKGLLNNDILKEILSIGYDEILNKYDNNGGIDNFFILKKNT